MQYEYVVFDDSGLESNRLQEELRLFGEERWELANAHEILKDNFITQRYIFKRPKEEKWDILKKDVHGNLLVSIAKEQPKECLCGLDESKGNYARMDIACPKHDAEPTVVNNVSCNVSGCRCGRNDTHGCS